MQEDPAGYINGANSYDFEENNTVDREDPTGMDTATTQPTTPVVGNQIGTVTTGPNSGSAVFPGLASDGSANGTWWIEVGGQWQQVPMNQIQSLPRAAYQPKPTTPTPSPAELTDQATYEMKLMQIWGNDFSEHDGEWTWQNQCDIQAANFMDYLRSLYFGGLDGKKPMWEITSVGGSGTVFNHNVVLLKPINGNPLPPMTLDTFHGMMPWQNKGRVCKLLPLQQFKAEYPNPVRTDK
jgi:hypothetical protein